MKRSFDLSTYNLPEELQEFVNGCPAYRSYGESGMQTLFIGGRCNAYLKIGECGSLYRAMKNQLFFHKRGLSAEAIKYISSEKDYLLVEMLEGADCTSSIYLKDPNRLAETLGTSLHVLHSADSGGCLVDAKMIKLSQSYTQLVARQDHLDSITEFIGHVKTESILEEVVLGRSLLQFDTLIHGDCCLPNVILNNWALSGFVDIADGGIGDKHYDLAWALWSLKWNLKSTNVCKRFLDAYGRDNIDEKRLRICSILAATD